MTRGTRRILWWSGHLHCHFFVVRTFALGRPFFLAALRSQAALRVIQSQVGKWQYRIAFFALRIRRIVLVTGESK